MWYKNKLSNNENGKSEIAYRNMDTIKRHNVRIKKPKPQKRTHPAWVHL